MMDRIIVRRNGKTVKIPVDDDGYVPVKALIARQEMRRPHAQMMDSIQTAKVVRPMKMTPEQAAPWFISPGRSDVQGIDAPADAIVTMRTRVERHAMGGRKKQKAGVTMLTRMQAAPYADLISDIVYHCHVGEYELLNDNGRPIMRFPLITEVNGVRMRNADTESYEDVYYLHRDPTGMVMTIALDDPYTKESPEDNRRPRLGTVSGSKPATKGKRKRSGKPKSRESHGNGPRTDEGPGRVHRAGPRDFFAGAKRQGSAYRDLPWITDPELASQLAMTTLSPEMAKAYLDTAEAEYHTAMNGGMAMDSFDSLNRRKGSFNPKRDMLPAFASAETGGEYPLSNAGFKHYLDDYADLHYIVGSKAAVMRELKSRLQPVPGLAIDIDVGDVQDSLEVLR